MVQCLEEEAIGLNESEKKSARGLTNINSCQDCKEEIQEKPLRNDNRIDKQLK